MAMKIGEILVGRGLITPAQLNDALGEQKRDGGKIGNILLRQGLISRRDLRQGLAEQARTMAAAATVVLSGTLGAAVLSVSGFGGSQNNEDIYGPQLRVGTVMYAAGDSGAVGANGNRHPVNTGAALFLGDIVQTGMSGRLHLQLRDASELTVGPHSEVRLDQFVFAAAPSLGDAVTAELRAIGRFIRGPMNDRDDAGDQPDETTAIRTLDWNEGEADGAPLR